MKKRMILRVANAILAACQPGAKPKLGFNMAEFVARDGWLEDKADHCKTVACIAGWACFVDTGHLREPKRYVKLDSDYGGYFNKAAELFGLDGEQARDLFNPASTMDIGSNRDISPLQAVATLRHLAATGNVDWTVPPVKRPAAPAAPARKPRASRARA